MNSCAHLIGSPTGTPRRMRSLVFMVLIRLKMVGAASGHTPSAQRCFVLFCRKDTAREFEGRDQVKRLLYSRTCRPRRSRKHQSHLAPAADTQSANGMEEPSKRSHRSNDTSRRIWRSNSTGFPTGHARSGPKAFATRRVAYVRYGSTSRPALDQLPALAH
jgi:hypothetical protein